MAYVKTNWQAGVTPLSEANMDHLETQYDEAVADLVAKSLYDAHSIVIAIVDNTPVVLAVPASRIVGRKAAGNIVALTGAEVLTLCGWTANKILQGAGAGIAPTEIDPPLTFTELAGGEDQACANINTWEDWDLSAIVPAGTKAVLVSLKGTTVPHSQGVRKNGTALVRIDTIPDYVATGNWGSTIITECDANRVIEIYVTDNIAYAAFSILGYWS